MSELITIDVNQPTMFNDFLLESNMEVLHDLTADRSVQNDKEASVELRINDRVVRVAHFNEVLDDWAKRIREQVKKELDYLKTEEAVFEKAEMLLDEKLGTLEEILGDVRMDTWKLGA